MYLESSSARSSKQFLNSDVIYGIDSEAFCTISTVDNLQVSYIQPLLNKTTDGDTSAVITGLFTGADLQPYDMNVAFNDKTTFHEKGALMYSTSNNLSEPTPKRFKFILTLNTVSNTTSPFIDIGVAELMVYRYNITNTSATTSKYISRVVELEQDFDAEDFKLYLTAYKPTGTDIKTYIRIQNSSDSVSFTSNDWIELEIEGSGLSSSTINRNDFREYVYKVADSDKVNGVVTYSNVSGTYNGYSRFAVKIEFLSTNIHNVPRLQDYRGIALT
jgi:hypothetical protein